MKPLSLQAINRVAPYKVTKLSESSFVFITPSGMIYHIFIDEDMDIAGCKSYQFVISNNEKGPYDPFVKTTILAILYEFFDKNDEIILYICDTSDGREASRNRLFLRWFKQEDIGRRFIIKNTCKEIEGETFYIAIILQKSNPMLHAVIDEFSLLDASIHNK